MTHTTDDSLKEFVHSLKPMIKSLQKQQRQNLKQLEPIVREAISSKNQEENYLGRLLDTLSDMAQFSGVGQELYHELLNYIKTFNPELAQWYRDNDQDIAGL
jgi:hypothetical protein